MANENVRIQVRENSTDHDWIDVGHKAGDESLPVTMGFSLPKWDYVAMALSAGDTTETYTFKSGGSGGTTVATVVVVYTTSTRDVLTSVTKT